MSDKFTVICPTMWLSESFPKFLPKLVECEFIDEILLINNNKKFTPTIAPSDKLKICTPNDNIGVNKSWNIGVLAAKNDKIAIINDDVVFNTDIFQYMLSLVTEDKGLVGLNLNTKGSSYNLVSTDQRYFGYACVFFIHKNNYNQIPESLKIYFGDDWLFEMNKRKGKINYYIDGFKTEGELSQTSKHFYQEYYNKEKDIYHLELNKMKTYRYSIIVPHYDGSIDDVSFERGINCLLNQQDQNFEVLIYHDGPVSRPIPDLYKQFGDRCKLIITEKRDNDWGHSNRDRGIREATGQWIIHFNPDNIVYPNLLIEISKIIDNSDKYPIFYNADRTKKIPSDAIIIFPIQMIGHYKFGLANMAACRIRGHDHQRFVFTGDPCVVSNVDCMQVVMKKDLWLKYGGWYDKRSYGDGVMYERIVSEEGGAKYCDQILGEHW